MNEVKNKISKIDNSVTTIAFTAVENKIHNNSNLVKQLTKTQNLVKLKIKLILIMIIINILLPKNCIG